MSEPQSTEQDASTAPNNNDSTAPVSASGTPAAGGGGPDGGDVAPELELSSKNVFAFGLQEQYARVFSNAQG